MELTATLAVRSVVIDLIETIGPIETHQTYHREEDAHTDTCRTLHIKRVEVLGLCPGVARLDESESVDRGIAQEERITELQREAIV